MVRSRQAILVENAGDERANGAYIPVDSLPPDANWTPGRLIWRHESQPWLHITYGYGSWWIGHYQNCVEDLYVTTGGSQDIPPVGSAVVWGFRSASGDGCWGGGGKRPLPRLCWRAPGDDTGCGAHGTLAEECQCAPCVDSSQKTFLCVDGAGEELVNGVYVPVESLPPDAGWTPGPLIWRHSKVDWLYITFGSSSWWIGHYRYSVRDFYVSTNGRSCAAPVGDTVTWGWRGAEGHQCMAGRGARPFPQLHWAPAWLPIDFEVVQDHLRRLQPPPPPAAAAAAGAAERWWGGAEELEAGLGLEAFLRLCGTLADSETARQQCGAVARGVVASPWLGWNSRVTELCSSEPLLVFPAQHSEHNAFSQMKHHHGEARFSPELWQWLASSRARWQLRSCCEESLVTAELRRLVGAELADAIGRGVLRLASCSMWAGATGTRTPLHRDYAPALILQVAGSKRFFLSSLPEVEAAVAEGLLPAVVRDAGNTDCLCLDGCQERLYGLSAPAPLRLRGRVAVLHEGDCLVLPANVFHDVECTSEAPVSLSLTLRLEISES